MKICWGVAASFCTLSDVYREIERLNMSAEAELYPVLSFNFKESDTRFGKAAEHISKIKLAAMRDVITTLTDAEKVGPVIRPDVMLIAPCTGNTLAKINLGISDTPLTLAAKAHMRNRRPLVIALATNDGLSGNFRNLAEMYQKKNVFFVPLRQDDPVNKPTSLVADMKLLTEAVHAAMEGKQLLPLFR